MSKLNQSLLAAAAIFWAATVASNADASSYCVGKYEKTALAPIAKYDPELKVIWTKSSASRTPASMRIAT